jgi:hypothetical protein
MACALIDSKHVAATTYNRPTTTTTTDDARTTKTIRFAGQLTTMRLVPTLATCVSTRQRSH